MKEALKLALEALEASRLLIHGSETKGGLVYCMDGYYSDCFDIDSNEKQTNEAITAIKEALAQPEQEQEADAVATLTEEGWIWDGDQWQRPAQPEQEIDWKDMYSKEKCRAEMWLAKYEQVAGPSPRAYPLAQPEQEPVAWGCNRYIEDDNGFQIGTDEPELVWGKYAPDDNGWWPLYTTPLQRKPLVWLSEEDERQIKDHCTTVACVLRAVKAKLKEKNT